MAAHAYLRTSYVHPCMYTYSRIQKHTHTCIHIHIHIHVRHTLLYSLMAASTKEYLKRSVLHLGEINLWLKVLPICHSSI